MYFHNRNENITILYYTATSSLTLTNKLIHVTRIVPFKTLCDNESDQLYTDDDLRTCTVHVVSRQYLMSFIPWCDTGLKRSIHTQWNQNKRYQHTPRSVVHWEPISSLLRAKSDGWKSKQNYMLRDATIVMFSKVLQTSSVGMFINTKDNWLKRR